MGWYDLFSYTYDRSLEALYRPYRVQALAALGAGPGATVLDLACGTGQNFDLLVAAVGPEGRVVGVDLSAGMLRQARRRADRAGWHHVTLARGDAQQLTPAWLREATGVEAVDGAVCTLGLSAMPAWEAAFQRSFDLLRPGGRYVLLDVHAARRVFQTRVVELMARADLSREVWTPLRQACPDFRLDELGGSPRTFGGTLFVASGTKPG
jgi:ubiquinone/menaquinone biosynthesis C-methylase UbiE